MPTRKTDQCLYYLLSGKYSKTCVKRPLSKIPKIGFQDQLLLNSGIKYCRMLLAECSSRMLIAECSKERSAILWTFIKLPFVIKIFGLSICEWPIYTGFTVLHVCYMQNFYVLASLCSRAGRFKPYLVATEPRSQVFSQGGP